MSINQMSSQLGRKLTFHPHFNNAFYPRFFKPPDKPNSFLLNFYYFLYLTRSPRLSRFDTSYAGYFYLQRSKCILDTTGSLVSIQVSSQC